jgi:peptide/nickel transport system ATP-binding protein
VADLLEVQDLTIDRESNRGVAPVLRNVSLRVGPGESLAILGESGCGKSILTRAMLGILPPGMRQTGGAVRFRGRDLRDLLPRQRRALRGAGIGLVFQEPSAALDPVWTIGRHLDEAIRFHAAMPAREARAATLRLLAEVGMPEPERIVREYAHRLSGGMQQRAMLAIALAGEPALLVADEPTASLDRPGERKILDLIDGLRRARGLALILVTHDLRVAADRCDRVAVLYAGRLVEEAHSGDFFSEPLHPYSRALSECAPSLAQATGPEGRFPVIAGSVPAPEDRPEAGCVFAPRCSRVFPRCLEAEPPPLSIRGRSVRCYLYE